MSSDFKRERAAWDRFRPFLADRQIYGIVQGDLVVGLFEDPVAAMAWGQKSCGDSIYILLSTKPVFFPLPIESVG